MASVFARNNENLEAMLKRFGRQVEDEKILKEYRDRQYFEKPSAIRRKKDIEAGRKAWIKSMKDKSKIELGNRK
jgi:small subunit ribosomal protein S21